MSNPKRYYDYFDPETFRAILKASQITHEELARATGIQKGTIQSYLTGRSEPGLSAAVKIADFFGLPVDVFAGHSTKEYCEAVLQGDYSKCFMQLRRHDYEATAAYRKEVLNHYDKLRGEPEAPYPYNLLDDVLSVGNYKQKKRWGDLLSPDQEAALQYVLSTFTEREQFLLKMYYEEGHSLADCSIAVSITRERVRQILAKCVRRIKHPSQLNLILYGLEGFEKRSSLALRKEELAYAEKELDEMEKELARRRRVLEEDVTSKLLSERRGVVTLSDMCLTVRSFNCLYGAGCRTLQDVCDKAQSGTLLQIPNLGRGSLNEILQKCKVYAGEDYEGLYADVKKTG